ncbi:MAG: deoxyhypusine synthase [Candidatus Nanoarchaeia archaeon]|nr:deoxyhypusine synthase [Candidatus Nanoarchaeia archaeon]
MENNSFKRDKKSSSINLNNLDSIKGFEVKGDINLKDLPELYSRIGFQASNVGKAHKILKKIKEEKIDLFLACTSNMVSSGLREIIAQLVKNKVVKAIITSTGAIEEDIMKCKDKFLVGDFNVDDSEVKENKINRIGNIFVKDESYCDLEEWHNKFLEEAIKEKNIWTPSEYIKKMGLKLDDKHSILYWAAKNNIPIFCPGFVDGALGDHFYFFNKKNKNKIVIDQAGDLENFYDIIIKADKTAGLILGGGIAKHHLIGAAILRNGLDYAVYVQTGTEGDGSLSGAKPKEAVSWNKLKEEKNSVLIEADATLVFPLIAGALI